MLGHQLHRRRSFLVLGPWKLQQGNIYTIISSFKVCKVFAFVRYKLLRMQDVLTSHTSHRHHKSKTKWKIIRIRVSYFEVVCKTRAVENATVNTYIFTFHYVRFEHEEQCRVTIRDNHCRVEVE